LIILLVSWQKNHTNYVNSGKSEQYHGSAVRLFIVGHLPETKGFKRNTDFQLLICRSK